MVLRKTLRRDQLLQTLASLPPCLIGMEACSGAHEWGHSDVSTMMIYTHVLNKGGHGVRSPLDRVEQLRARYSAL